MHRKVKGLLSLILTFAMVTAAVAPVSADELSGKEQPTAEEQPTTEIVLEEQDTTEAESVEEPLSEEPTTTEIKPEEQITEEEPLSDSDSDLDFLYNNLTEEQKKFDVYAGERPLSEVIQETDVLSKLVFESEGVTPDAGDLNSKAGELLSMFLAKREGDLNFYSLSKWNVWHVDNNGIPDRVIASHSSLSRLATESNFKQAAYLVNEGTGTAPMILINRPILELVWSCIDYVIPVYDSNGNDTGTTITINAENYNDSSQVSFPNIDADCWKLIYNGTEYNLNTASEIWTNEANGIRTIGRNFNESQARIQAVVLSVPEEDKYEIFGAQGNEGWYIEAVTVHAKDGYQIRLSEADAWSDEVSVTESSDVTLYLKKSDGTELPTETLRFLIDGTAPVISGIEDGGIYYDDEVAAVVTDEYLHAVAINGGTVGIYNNRADIMLCPSENPYIISAEDMAGNRVEYTVWVKESDILPVLKEGTAEFMQPDWYEGEQKPEPIVSSATNGIENITYYYKEAGADDSAYTNIQPEKAGSYTAKAVFAATEEYQEVIRTSDFEILPNIPVVDEPTEPDKPTEPDETAPVIDGVSDGQVYYGDQAVTVTDENLRTVTVNGEAVEVSNNRADITLKPAEDVYKIIAVDEAGNRTELMVEVLETWVRDGIITNGKKKLRRERIYKLGTGQWTIDGDSTVYSGGGTFYVKNDGEYNFQRK